MAQHKYDLGEYGVSGPEEGDKVDLSVFVVDSFGSEIIEITAGTTAKRKRLLNEGEARFDG